MIQRQRISLQQTHNKNHQEPPFETVDRYNFFFQTSCSEHNKLHVTPSSSPNPEGSVDKFFTKPYWKLKKIFELLDIPYHFKKGHVAKKEQRKGRKT